MGASNALRVYAGWGKTLGDKAMRVFTYMALVARDGDAEPWFGLGHEAISELALSEPMNGDLRHDQAALRAVRRAVTELHRQRAVTVFKRQTNKGQHVHYRLWLDGPSPDENRPVNNPPACEQPPSEPVENHPLIGHKPSYDLDRHRTKSGQSPDEIRPIHIRKGGGRGANTSNGPVVTANCGRQPRSPP